MTTASRRRVAGATAAGSFIEWYDFNVFGVASALVFGRLFFPSASPVSGTLLSFAVFATAWVTRPLGALIFGHLGDRMGRKNILLATLLLMGTATVLTGLLPTYDAIGVWAPALLVVLRMVQGISAGGEWSGAATLATEHAPPGREGFYGSFPQVGTPLALVAANGVTLLSQLLAPEQFAAWGWRIPFLFSAVMLPIAYWIRRGVDESPDFESARAERGTVRLPLAAVLRDHWRAVLVVLVLMGGINVCFYTFGTYVLSYATRTAGFSPRTALLALTVAAAVMIVSTLVFGRLSDRLDRREMYIVGFGVLALTPYPLFALIDTGSTVAFVLAISAVFGVAFGCVWSIAAAYFTEQFPVEVRYSGSAIGYHFSGTVFGGPTPLIAASLVAAAGGRPWLAAAYVSGVALLAVLAAYLAPRAHPARADARDMAAAVRPTKG